MGLTIADLTSIQSKHLCFPGLSIQTPLGCKVMKLVGEKYVASITTSVVRIYVQKLFFQQDHRQQMLQDRRGRALEMQPNNFFVSVLMNLVQSNILAVE